MQTTTEMRGEIEIIKIESELLEKPVMLHFDEHGQAQMTCEASDLSTACELVGQYIANLD
jgi:hypothetical protein